MSSDVLKRDVTGKCEEGECRDRVSEGFKDRKIEIEKIEKEDVKAFESYPEVPGAEKLNNPDNPAAGIPGGRGKK